MNHVYVCHGRNTILGLVTAGLLFLIAGPAQAQYWSGFSYYNPRTGYGYSQGAAYGNGRYSGGFSYSSPRRSYGSYYGYGGRHYWGGYSYGSAAGRYGYGYRY